MLYFQNYEEMTGNSWGLFQVLDCLISEQLVPFSVFPAGKQHSKTS